jgi:hypothetical protein
MEASMFAQTSLTIPRGHAGPFAGFAGGIRRRFVLTLLAAILPLGAILTQGTVAQASIPPAVCGTWAMLQVSKVSAVTYFTPSIDAALAIPGVKGLSLRASWSNITANLSIYDAGLQVARAAHSSLAIRFLSGIDTPAQFLGNSTTMAGKPIPLPWGAGTTPTSFVPNTTFETAYRATVNQLATYAKANGIHVLHLPWYSGPTAEIYDGPEVQAAPGYSIQNFLTGYERLAAIGMSVADSTLTVEYPLGGVGTGPFVTPLETYMSTHYGSNNPELMMQFNDLGGVLPGQQHPAIGVNLSRQMQGQGDYNWTNVYAQLVTQHSQTVEIYLNSFAPTLAHAALLRQQAASFASTC